MTDEERKQFINEYCRNVGNIKIKCDDCKFVEDCVDYGWADCKKFTPTPSEPMTNEEWLRSCNTEQLADVLGKIAKSAYQCGQDGKTNKCVNRKNCTGYCDYGWEMWLKQPHHESVKNCNE